VTERPSLAQTWSYASAQLFKEPASDRQKPFVHSHIKLTPFAQTRFILCITRCTEEILRRDHGEKCMYMKNVENGKCRKCRKYKNVKNIKM
jgi:hypothetical protein